MDKDKADKETTRIALKKPLLKMGAFSWDADLLRGNVNSNSLFGEILEEEESVTVLNNISENEEAYLELKTLVSGLAESEKRFILIEGDLGKEEIKFFEKAGVEIVEGAKEKVSQAKDWGSKDKNPFAIADAVGRRSAKEAWIEYIKSRMNDSEPEEIHGRVIGKVRDILTSQVASPEEIGMHPFVHRKAKMDLKNWKEEDLRNFYSRLVSIYHESRMGGEELDSALEKELLKI